MTTEIRSYINNNDLSSSEEDPSVYRFCVTRIIPGRSFLGSLTSLSILCNILILNSYVEAITYFCNYQATIFTQPLFLSSAAHKSHKYKENIYKSTTRNQSVLSVLRAICK